MIQLLTLTELLENWHYMKQPVKYVTYRDMDMDDLFIALRIRCPEAEGKDILVSDTVADDFGYVHGVSFIIK